MVKIFGTWTQGKGYITGMILLLCIIAVHAGYTSMRKDQYIMPHSIIYGDLQDYFQSEGKLPEKIFDLARYKETDTTPPFDSLVYRREAWGKPETILLLSEGSGGRIIITFGDGTHIIGRGCSNYKAFLLDHRDSDPCSAFRLPIVSAEDPNKL